MIATDCRGPDLISDQSVAAGRVKLVTDEADRRRSVHLLALKNLVTCPDWP